MNEENIKNLNEIIELCEEEINNNDENVTAILDLTDLKSLRNLINRNRGLEALKNSCPAIPTTGIECDLKKELEEDYTSVYLKGIYDERDKWKSKIKELLDNKFIVLYEGDAEFPDDATEINEVKYIKAKYLEELLQEGE